jgi:hypothetical protein
VAKITKIPLSENDLKYLIVEYLQRKKHFVWVNNTGQMSLEYTNKRNETKKRFFNAGLVGSSDILGIHKKTGQFIAVECKVGRNKTTAAQEAFLEEIRDRNGIAIVAYTLEDVQKYL